MAITAPVFFILGGPGSGKGTACARLVDEFGMTHISAGDLLRDEVKTGSELGQKIESIISVGNIVPSEITVELLRQSMARAPSEFGYLIDGFPRKFDQAKMFEDGIAKAKRVYYFECSEATMESRCLTRAAETAGTATGRSDDSLEVIRRRFRVNIEQCVPVVEMYKNEGRCTIVDANATKDEVYAVLKAEILGMGIAPVAKN